MTVHPRLELSQLTGRGTTAFAIGYFVAMAIFAFWSIDGVRNPVPTVIGLGLFGLTSVLLVRDKGEILSLRVTLLVIALGTTTALLISWQITDDSFTVWYYNAGCVALFLVILRGRILLAWVGYLAISGVMAAWGATTAYGIADALFLVANQLTIIVIGTTLAVGLRRNIRRIRLLAAETSARAAAEATAQATTAERNTRLEALNELVAPLLAKLVDGVPLSDEDRLEFAVAEAALRDSMRARALDVPIVVAAARDARRRGVEVVLLDDSTPSSLDPDDLARAAQATVAALTSAEDGQVTARLLPAGRSAIATIVVDGSRYERSDIRRAD
jgi:hypothetical protein